jgi:hypothetical protein
MGFMVMALCSLAVVMNVSDEVTVSAIRVIVKLGKCKLWERWGDVTEARRSSQSVKE